MYRISPLISSSATEHILKTQINYIGTKDDLRPFFFTEDDMKPVFRGSCENLPETIGIEASAYAPEMATKEETTSRYISEALGRMGVPHSVGVEATVSSA